MEMIISTVIIIFTMIVKIPIFAILKMNENMGKTAVIYKYANRTPQHKRNRYDCY